MKPIIDASLPHIRSPVARSVSILTTTDKVYWVHSQRLETLDTNTRREGARNEGEQRRARLAEAGDPSDAASEDPRREDARGVVHDDKVDGSDEDADEGDGDATADEGGDDSPDYEFEST